MFIKKHYLKLIKKNITKYSALNLYRKKGIKIIDNGWVKNVKKSNRLFVLGSGPSINYLSDNDWSIIRSYDSVGFNFWWLHDFVPTFYIAQEIFNKNSLAYKMDLMRKSYLQRQSDYQKVPIVFRGSILNNRKLERNLLFNDLYSYNPEKIVLGGELSLNLILRNSNSFREFKQELLFLKLLGWFKKGRITRLIPKFSSTVTFIMSLACQMGYDEIILCGIDMNNTDHFYDNHNSNISLLLSTENSKKKVHPHNIAKKSSALSVRQAIIVLSEILDSEGVKVYIQSSSSSLYPDLKISDVF